MLTAKCLDSLRRITRSQTEQFFAIRLPNNKKTPLTIGYNLLALQRYVCHFEFAPKLNLNDHSFRLI